MTAREVALRALHSMDTEGTYINEALKAALSNSEIQDVDKGFVTELLYGVTTNKIAIDYILMQFSKIKIKKMSTWVLAILRMGIFQIYYMDKIPNSAACNESVKLAKRYSHGAGAGFVNGVLRSAVRGKEDFKFPKTQNAVQDLALKYSYPEWMVQKLVSEYGVECCEELFSENQKPHSVGIRVNTLKTTSDNLVDILKNEGISCEGVLGHKNALMITGKFNSDKSKAYKDGLFSLQNISSQMAVEVLNPQKGDFVIDMCAAPGGKSCAAAETMENTGRIVSFDVFEHKIKLINHTAKRLGIDIIDARVSNSAVKIEQFVGKADKVIADVPCSGLGVIHKKPDIKWKRTEEDVQELCKLQREILEVAALYVKNGGVLLYSTCTILPEENRIRIDEFLKNHTDFKKVFEKQILTGKLGESGFYICKMVKEYEN